MYLLVDRTEEVTGVSKGAMRAYSMAAVKDAKMDSEKVLRKDDSMAAVSDAAKEDAKGAMRAHSMAAVSDAAKEVSKGF